MSLRTPAHALTILAAVVFVVSVSLRAQISSSTETPSFEVASIKRNNSVESGFGISGPAPGRFTATNAPLDRVIMYAFGVRDDQIVGVPDWARNERFDINAKYSDGFNVSGEQVAAMTRRLLADRFHLNVHKETRDAAIYALVPARKDGRLGPKLKAMNVDCSAYLAEKRAAGEVVRATGVGDAPLCSPTINSPRSIKGSVKPIGVLAGAIGIRVGRLVVDRTGLSGNFDFNLEWSDLSTDPTSRGAAGRAAQLDAVAIFTALDEQLGLKLESTRGPVEMLVIDHLERPMPD